MRNSGRWISLGAGGVSFGVLMLIYLRTMAPTLTWAHYGADGGDLITAVARGSIPHPPGFPAYLLLGELFIRLPWRDPAWRLNLMSAVMAAAAAVVGSREQRTASSEQRAGDGHLASCILHLVSCLLLGLAPLFWSQALIAEVYTTAAFFTALVVTLTQRRQGPAATCALGLAWGVGVGVHPTLVFLLPLILAADDAWGGKRETRGKIPTPYSLLLVSFLLGCGIMYGPVLLARARTPSPWGDVSTPAGWWALVSGRLYHGYAFGLPWTAWPRRLLTWVGLLARQFTPVGALLAGWGWTRLQRERRALATGSALAFGAFSLYAIGYNTTDSLVYLVPALPLAALWLGEGLAQAAAWLECRKRGLAALLLLLPALQVALFWRQMDVSRDRSALEWAERALREAPARAVVITGRDRETFALWYVHDVLGERPDVTVIDVGLWGQETYRRTMGGELGIDAAGGLSPEEAARRAGRPVVERGLQDINGRSLTTP